MTDVRQAQHGSSGVQGDLWSERSLDWCAFLEPTMQPLFEAVLRRAAIERGARLLDAGCGAGLFLELAAERGAIVAGVDAAPSMIAIARDRVPTASVRAGDLEDLPYDDATFDIVTAFNSVQYAASPVNALREARRVKTPDAPLFIAVWGNPEDCEGAAYLGAVGANLPAPPPAAPGPFALSQPGTLEQLVRTAGLTPGEQVDVLCPWQFHDLDAALRGLLSTGPAVAAIRHSGAARVAAAVTNAISPYRTARGGYRLENTFRYLMAR
jgi:SAM-dependent methyltransferase